MDCDWFHFCAAQSLQLPHVSLVSSVVFQSVYVYVFHLVESLSFPLNYKTVHRLKSSGSIWTGHKLPGHHFTLRGHLTDPSHVFI